MSSSARPCSSACRPRFRACVIQLPEGLRPASRRSSSNSNSGIAGDTMIIGIGSDIIDIRRIEKTIERHGDRFLDRIFTDTERLKSDRRAARAASYAKRFAAKEACAKALGTGLNQGVFWRDMRVVNLPSGQPT